MSAGKLINMGAKKDLRTLFSRFFLVVVYCLVGAGIFYAIEHNDHYDEVEEINRKQQLYNKTKTDIMRRFGINDTEFEALVSKVIDAKSNTPLEWTFTRGIDLCWQTITTVGRCTRGFRFVCCRVQRRCQCCYLLCRHCN